MFNKKFYSIKKTSAKLVLLVLLVALTRGISYSQLIIDTTLTPKKLVTILLGKESALKIENVKYTGAKQSIGLFKNNYVTKIISKGIILSTGNVYDAIGPNSDKSVGKKLQTDGDADVEKIAAGITYDAAILEIDFISLSDSISFNYFFASNEYPIYVDKGVNDAFAFFLCDDELKTKKNMAVLESNGMPITINNINSHKNSEYFIPNLIWNENNMNKLKNNKELLELSYYFRFNGLTKLLHAGSKVIPNKKYRLKIVIADVGDRIYDSAVFLEFGSFNSTGVIPANLSNNSILSDSEITILKTKDTLLTKNIKVEFQLNSDKISGTNSSKLLNQILTIVKGNNNIQLEIIGHTDNTGNTEYNKTLSFNRAKAIAEYLISLGVDKNRIKYYGLGDTKPIATNNNEEGRALNRRVEIVFKTK